MAESGAARAQAEIQSQYDQSSFRGRKYFTSKNKITTYKYVTVCDKIGGSCLHHFSQNHIKTISLSLRLSKYDKNITHANFYFCGNRAHRRCFFLCHHVLNGSALSLSLWISSPHFTFGMLGKRKYKLAVFKAQCHRRTEIEPVCQNDIYLLSLAG